jgi:O-antigen/teichoic acid export membrane protein
LPEEERGSLRRKTASGVFWQFLETAGKRGINLLVTFLLARFLAPKDFGIIAMMSVFLALANSVMDSGFKLALIRKNDATQTDFSTVFYANLMLGAASYLALFFSSPLIADFYNEPHLILIIRVAAVALILNSFQIVQTARFSRTMNFKAQMKAALPGSVLSGVIAVAMAFMDYGVWALVAQIISASFFISVFYWRLSGWRPTREFSTASLKELFGFGSKLFVSGVIDTLFKNVYVLVIGKLFAGAAVGFYFFAQKIQELILIQLTESVQNVTFPALSGIQHDNERLKEAYRKILQVTTYAVFPVMTFLAGLAMPLFTFLLDDKWLEAVPYLQLLCVGGLMYPLHSLNLNILKVKGRSDLFLYLEIVKKFFIVVILVVSVRYGVKGIVIGQVINSFVSFIPNSYFSVKLINYSVREQAADCVPAFLLSSACGLLIYAGAEVLNIADYSKIIILGFCGVALYVIAARLLKFRAQTEILTILSERFMRK